ncbi:MAG: DUF362 domain-containing protein [Chrysiogenales bacterium]|nr:MAG: DUF362 domain-containing protein [Chrysiogenales bacterium]
MTIIPSRREFIRRSLIIFGGLVMAATLPWNKKRDTSMAMERTKPRDRKSTRAGNTVVAIEPCGSYDPRAVHHALIKILEALRFNVPRGIRVLLKPNIIAQNTPDQATTTHPSVVEASCRIFIDNGCRVTIGDSSAFYQGGGTREGFVTTGIAAVAKRYGATLLPFEATTLRKITSGEALNPFYVTGAAFEHDLVVNLPKLKVHRLARYTGAIKNIYGCIPGGTKQVYHKLYQHHPEYRRVWGKPLVDVYESINPGLNILDAVVGLHRDGPAANGEPRRTGVLMASRDGAALDVVACRMIGFDPLRVPAVEEAVRRGLTPLDGIRVLGNLPLVPYAEPPESPPPRGLMGKIDDYVFDQFIVEPRVDGSACDGCGACVEMCAVKALAPGAGGIPRVDYRACIFCYCCEEYCTRGAVSLHGGVVNHAMRAVRYLLKL